MNKYPDNVLFTEEALLGEHRRKRMKKDTATHQRENIREAVCAVLNSGGGIVIIPSSDKDFKYSTDGLGLDLENELNKLICDLPSPDYYEFSQEGSDLIIFVKTWGRQKKYPKLCTADTGLYIRNFTSKKIATAMQVEDLIERKSQGEGKRFCSSTVPVDKSVIEGLLKREYLCLNEKLEFSESNYVDFKDFSSEKYLQRIREEMKLYFSAFGNSSGGYLIIGVDDKGTVKGCARESNRSDLKCYIEECIKRMIFVHLGDCKQKNEFHTLTIKDVRNENNHSGFVICLEIKPVCCLCFVKDPQSWIFNGKPVQLSASEWVKIVAAHGSEPALEVQFERLTIEERPPLAKQVYTKKGMETLLKLQNNLFGNIEDRTIIKPDELFKDLKAQYPDLKYQLNNLVPDSGAVLLVSRSWAVDVDQKSNPNVICDILLLSPNNYPTLYSVFSAEVSENDFFYAQKTAFALKERLVNIGGYKRKLCVIPKMLCLNAEDDNSSFPWLEMKYPETYKLPDLGSVKELLPSLTIVILCFRNTLGDKFGIELFNLLTIEQYKLLSTNLKMIPALFVHGPPGTGKTVIALEIIKKIRNIYDCSTDDILYICENRPLKEYVGSLNICRAMTRERFETNEHIKVKHIVADEAQNFRVDKINWYKKAKDICQKSNGVFWVFLDYFQSYQKEATGLPEHTSQNKYLLTQSVRNPESIHKKIIQKMQTLASSKFLKEQIEQFECCHGIEGFFQERRLLKEEIVRFVSQSCVKYLVDGYTQRDIAILCSKKEAAEEFKALLYKEMERPARKHKILVKFRNAEEITEDGIIVDSVRRFSGMECCTVFVINNTRDYYREKKKQPFCLRCLKSHWKATHAL
ncbi:hypothetical protein GDO81_005781 [Engystomops pustulosus]|uniref:HTH cro/C1-type domain-containing protein n=1 Tax=Engystomops pustulosus TaxID=76066 RepID=A0AAV7CS05_ENGPU|nr:hypothetical protein GDO81_005781 [Engystomops pustulosus]